MRIGAKVFRRNLTLIRNPTTKGAKLELNFKENNQTPNPYDVIDHNVSGIEQRIRLYEMRRLKKQIYLDKRELESLKLNNTIDTIFESKRVSLFDMSYDIYSGFPGINYPAQSSANSDVTVVLDFECFKLKNIDKEKLIEIFKCNKSVNRLEFTVTSFPLISQNKNRAVAILKELLNLVRNQGSKHAEMNIENIKFYEAERGSNENTSSSEDTLKFPAEWLQVIANKNA